MMNFSEKSTERIFEWVFNTVLLMSAFLRINLKSK